MARARRPRRRPDPRRRRRHRARHARARRRGHEVVALDLDPDLLGALAGAPPPGLAVETVVADARDFVSAERFGLSSRRCRPSSCSAARGPRAASCARRARTSRPAALVAIALADALDTYDGEDASYCRCPTSRRRRDVYASQPVAMRDDGDTRRDRALPRDRHRGRPAQREHESCTWTASTTGRRGRGAAAGLRCVRAA